VKKNEQEQLIKWGKIAAVAFIGYKLLKPLGTAGATLSNVIATKAENTALQSTTGLSENEITLCRDVANKCHDAMNVTGFWQMSYFGGSTEDEEAVIAQLNRLSTAAHASTASSFYQTLSGTTLAADVNKYLDADDRKKIKAVILSNLM
jgi:hypothetical protein